MTKRTERWYAVYTTPRAEKKVSLRLEQQGISHYLPMTKTLRQWSDRKKMVESPLFGSYLFVHIHEADYYRVLNTNGVVRYVTFDGKAAEIPAYQIEIVKRLLHESVEMEVCSEPIGIGDPVEVMAGPLMGTLGVLVSHRGENRMAIKIDYVHTAILVNIPGYLLERVKDFKKLELLGLSAKFA